VSLIYIPKGEALEYAFYGINHYIGCSHGCTYCYMRKMYERYQTPGFDKPRAKMDPVDFIRALSKDAVKLIGKTGSTGSPFNKRVQLCFATDPYIPLDGELKLTRAVIEVLRECRIPFQILTKGGDLAQRDFDLYGPNDLFGVTLTVPQADEISEELEPYAASPQQRMANLKTAHAAGIKTWVSLEPVLWPADSLKIIEQTADFVNLYKIGKLNPTGPITNELYRKFAIDAVDLCEQRGVKYYLKDNLAKLLPAGSFSNTDWRMV
jgi:DNA repair photolyase